MRDQADKTYLHPGPRESKIWRLAILTLSLALFFMIGVQVGMHQEKQRCLAKIAQATEALRFCAEQLDDKNLHDAPKPKKRR